MTSPKQVLAAILALLLVPVWSVHGANTYLEMSLEDLMDVTVTSMSKRAQALQETAAAVHIVTGEDIRRSGATCIPEALRMVPGLMVAQNNAGIWSVSSRGRGFNPIFENKLLVLIDGRSVYSPVYSGVFWETIDVVMEDIDRIEIIRGPGTSVWGTNAVNGIINIITKSAADTQGLMASVLYGTAEKGTGALRHGGKFGEDNSYRIFTKYRHLDETEDIDGNDIPGELESALWGFKTDIKPDQRSVLTLQGDITSGNIDGTLTYPDMSTNPATTVESINNSDLLLGNVMAHYSRELDKDSNISVQSYYSHDDRDGRAYSVAIDTMDLDFQHQFSPLENHAAQWGLGYRLTSVSANSDENAVVFGRNERSDDLFSAFLQDEISFLDGKWILTLGSKFEHNEQTGLEILPSARLLWHVTEQHALWGAISRSVRTPSIAEQDIIYHIDGRTVQSLAEVPPGSGNYVPVSIPVRTSLLGDADLDSEAILVYELGHRFTPSTKFLVDTSIYLAQGDNILSAARSATQPTQLEIMQQLAQNGFTQNDINTNNDEKANMYGLEVSATWTPLDRWKLQGWYAYYEDDYDYDGDGLDNFESMYGDISPRHQFFLRSSISMPHDTELDIMSRYVSELPGLDIPDYATIDARLGWHVSDKVEISLVGKNLFEPNHQESRTDIVYGSAATVERSCYLKLKMDF